MRALLNLRVWSALALFCAVAFVFGMLGGRAFDHEYDQIDKRVQRIEILACGFTQFEDYSVFEQADVRSREICVDYILGRKVCDRVERGDVDYLINCREK